MSTFVITLKWIALFPIACAILAIAIAWIERLCAKRRSKTNNPP
jgi:hypothetical protein